jgi:hypothetical protein
VSVLPVPTQPIVDKNGKVTQPWYVWLSQIASQISVVGGPNSQKPGLELGIVPSDGVGTYGHRFNFGSVATPTRLELYSNSPSSSGPRVSFFHDSISPAANDSLGAALWWGRNSSAAAKQYAVINGLISTVTASSEAGRLECSVLSGGASVTPLRIDGDGLKFFGDTAAANALDDYEIGTFVPAITGSVSNPTITYGNVGGSYIKIGNVVCAWYAIQVTTIAGGSGDIRVTLPFVSSAAEFHNPSANVKANNWTWGVGNTMAYAALQTNSAIVLYVGMQSGAAQTVLQISDIQNASSTTGACVYQVD